MPWFTRSIRCRISRAASGSSPVTAGSSPAQIRTTMVTATAPRAVVSVPRTSPYRWARASAGSASIKCTTSASSADRWASASSNRSRPSGSSASNARSTAAVSATRLPESVTSASFAVAAVSTVVPQTAASITDSVSSGRHEVCQVSRNVPRPAISLSAGRAQPRSSTRSRWNNTERCWSSVLRRSRSCSLGTGSRFSRSRRQDAARSASSGTVGTPGSTCPIV